MKGFICIICIELNSTYRFLISDNGCMYRILILPTNNGHVHYFLLHVICPHPNPKDKKVISAVPITQLQFFLCVCDNKSIKILSVELILNSIPSLLRMELHQIGITTCKQHNCKGHVRVRPKYY